MKSIPHFDGLIRARPHSNAEHFDGLDRMNPRNSVGLKIPHRKVCRFDSGPGHHSYSAIKAVACSAFVPQPVPQKAGGEVE